MTCVGDREIHSTSKRLRNSPEELAYYDIRVMPLNMGLEKNCS